MEKIQGDKPSGSSQPSHRGRVWRWTLWSVLLAGAVLICVLQILVARAGPILKGRVIETLSTRFDSKVQLDTLQVSVLHGLTVTGSGLRIYPPDDVMAAGVTAPLIAVNHFFFRTGLLGLMFKPMHVGTVHIQGLAINIPPRQLRARNTSGHRHLGKIKIQVDQIVCDDSRLIIGTNNPGRDPKLFQLKHIVLHDVGPSAPWAYNAVLTNAVPEGDIHAIGSFGPWNTESPGDSSVTGKYLFDHADLNTIKGLGGMLHSSGTFEGKLNRIAIQGTTDTPGFSLDSANHPMPLWTSFSAIVDGISGDTYLEDIQARLAGSSFSCRGTVINVKDKGHVIDLDVDVPAGRIQDFLQLSVKTEPAIMTGILETTTRLHISPGKESVSQKLSLQGDFTLKEIHFTNPKVEDKVDMLSLRAQGKPKEAKPGAPDVHSTMTGQFTLNDGRVHVTDLKYVLPGATVQLTGIYALDGRQFDFTGHLRTTAELSQMIASKWKSLLLKPIDPFFRKDGAGAQIPIKIYGTRGAPHFGLDFHLGKKDADQSSH